MSTHSSTGELEKLRSEDFSGTGMPPLLSRFLVTPILSASEYNSRIREVLAAVIETVKEFDALSDQVPVGLIPDWFVGVTCGLNFKSSGPEFKGARYYVSCRHEEPWELQEWLFCFDPQMRGWRWWDLTWLPDGSIQLWVDSSGEPVFPCEELRWLAYVCGAKNVDGPILIPISAWLELRQGLEPSN
jgi:hypothetical protein